MDRACVSAAAAMRPPEPTTPVHAPLRSLSRNGDTMSRNVCLVAILATATTLGAPLRAQENAARETPAETSQPQPQVPPQTPEFGDPRFAFHRIDSGFVRLDLHTGAVASCSQNAAGWICVPGREERAALDREIARLRRDTAVLKNALLERGLPLPNDIVADAPLGIIAPAPAESVPRPPQSVPPVASTPPASPKSAEPDHASRDDAELERVMNVMEKFWRRLVEMMMSIQRDMQKKG